MAAIRAAIRRCRFRAWLTALASLGLTTVSLAAESLHGADALFRGGGLTIAWAVARERDEDKTAVVLAIADPDRRYDGVEVIGIDPFADKTETLTPRAPLDRASEIRLPRNRFAELPRTELRFYARGALATTIYYLGVPDTTPEFPDLDRARRYLAQTVR